MRKPTDIVLCQLLTLGLLLWGASGARAVEHVSLKRDGTELQVSGKILVEAQDGGMLLLAPDGALWIIQPEEIQSRRADEQPFAPWDQDEIARRLLEELPAGFRIHQTANYVICYNTSDAYAEWCGALYERLNRAFYSFWKNRGLALKDSEFPLVALVFDDKASYADYSRPEIGEAVQSIIGYYNMRTNRVTMYDLTGADELRKYQRRGSSAAHINQILSQPAAERTVATIVHEATHQLAYNSGLQTRYADNPLWVSEGIAVYFETPDLRSSRGWRNIGARNPLHLTRFISSLGKRPPDALETLLTDDARFRDPQTSSDAYAGAWALNYYLLKARHKEYVAYLQDVGQRQPLEELTGEQRLARFKRAFGDDLAAFDQDFVRFMRRIP